MYVAYYYNIILKNAGFFHDTKILRCTSKLYYFLKYYNKYANAQVSSSMKNNSINKLY